VKRLILLAAILASIIILAPVASASTETSATAAADGVFPSGSQYQGVNLQASKFGIGVDILGDGTAYGDFHDLLIGTTALGLPQNIDVLGAASSGLLNANGTATFSGTSTVDLGNGTPPTTGVPFTATLATTGLTLTLGATALPTQSVTAGSITIISQ
jgi:hypothetical protein